MGQLIPLFGRTKKTDALPPQPPVSGDASSRLKLVINSLEAHKKEEQALQNEIMKKCHAEIDRLNELDRKIRDLEQEASHLCRNLGQPIPGFGETARKRPDGLL
ncbi:MAG TPA: hypothetical protein PKO06_18750 [Candidatus Ozemobacteraceae bacterium]|nr:hypothetical protein [Candidatus Ozemobacteraceae bacterium]